MSRLSLFRKVTASLLLMYCASNVGAQGVIRTIAGTGISGLSGEGGPAVSANLSNPSGVAVDAGGNIYIADLSNSRVRMIQAATGNIVTVAGTTWGYAGMGGPAVSAQIRMPNAIFVDNSDNYFFTDWYNDAAFKVDASSHNIANYCGHDSQGYDGDGGDASLASLEVPNGLWVDNASGNVYIIDAGSNHLRMVNGATHIVTTLAGGIYGYSGDGGPLAAAGFAGISGVCTDTHGNMYLSDKGNNVIRKVDVSGTVFTIAGTGVAGYTGDGGSGQTAKFNQPGALFINDAGYLFICDIGNNAIRVLNTNTDMINTLAGNGTMGFSGDLGLATAAQLNAPAGVWQDVAGTVYIADEGNQRVRKVTGSGYKTSPSSTTTLTETTFNIYPSPSNGNFTIETNGLTGNANVDIFNMVGTKLYSQLINGTTANISIKQPSGVYTMVIKSANGSVTRKISIQ